MSIFEGKQAVRLHFLLEASRHWALLLMSGKQKHTAVI